MSKDSNKKVFEFETDEETARKLEKLAGDFNQTPGEFVRQMINGEWKKAKDQGKIGEA